MLASLVSAAGTLGGAYIGNSISANSARATNAANLKYAQDTYDTQINLSNTAHQREVRDLRAAGLNPILSASGSGSASPAAPSVDLQNPDASFASLGDAFNSAGGHLGKGVQRQMDRAQLASQLELNALNGANTAENTRRLRLENERTDMVLEAMRKDPKLRTVAALKDAGGPLGGVTGLGAWSLDGTIDWLKSLFGNTEGTPTPAEHTVGGETIHVRPAGHVSDKPGTGVQRRMNRESHGGRTITIEYDGKGPGFEKRKRHHN